MNRKMNHRMDNESLKNFAQLIFVARGLNCSDDGIENAGSEYVIGQAEMVMDFCGITSLYDENFYLVQKLIVDKDFMAVKDDETEVGLNRATNIFMSKFPHLTEAEARLFACIPVDEELINEDGDNLLPSRILQ